MSHELGVIRPDLTMGVALVDRVVDGWLERVDGPDTRVTALSVEWPDGSTSTHPVESVDREIRISQP